MRIGILLLFCLACSSNGSGPRACTLIGCVKGLNVVVNSSLQQDYTVNVKSGTQQLATATCRAGQPCNVFVENQQPASVVVEIVTPDGTVQRTFNPQYVATRPNGPDCPPECRQATVTVNVS